MIASANTATITHSQSAAELKRLRRLRPGCRSAITTLHADDALGGRPVDSGTDPFDRRSLDLVAAAGRA